MKDAYYWDSRRKRYVLHAFDRLFKSGGGELRFHHYKASIVISGGEVVWLYTNADFDRLIKLINRARKACLNAPALAATEHNAALQELRKKRKTRRRRRLRRGGRS